MPGAVEGAGDASKNKTDPCVPGAQTPYFPEAWTSYVPAW